MAKAKKTVKKKPVASPKLTANERKWRAEDDARSLIAANSVMDDKKRLQAAKVQVKIMANQKAQELKSIKKVAKRK